MYSNSAHLNYTSYTISFKLNKFNFHLKWHGCGYVRQYKTMGCYYNILYPRWIIPVYSMIYSIFPLSACSSLVSESLKKKIWVTSAKMLLVYYIFTTYHQANTGAQLGGGRGDYPCPHLYFFEIFLQNHGVYSNIWEITPAKYGVFKFLVARLQYKPNFV